MDVTITTGGGDGKGDGVKRYYHQDLGIDPRVGYKEYFQVDIFQNYGGSSNYWPEYSKARLRNLSAFMNEVPGRSVQITFDMAPQGPTQWAANPQQAITLYAPFMKPYWQKIINGDPALIAEIRGFFQACKDLGLDTQFFNIIVNHEGMAGFWYPWSACVDKLLWNGAQKRIIKEGKSILKNARFSIDFGGNALVNADQMMDDEITSLIDTISTDPYLTHSQIYPPPVDEMMHCIQWAEAHGKGVDLPEVGGVGHAVDGELRPYFENMLSRAKAHPCIKSFGLFIVQPEDTTYKPDGSVQYYGSGACDFLRQIPRPFPLTFKFTKEQFIPQVLAMNSSTSPPVVVPPSSTSLTFPDSVVDPTDPKARTVTNADGSVKVDASPDISRVVFWQGGGVNAGEVNPSGGKGSIKLKEGVYWPLGTNSLGNVYSNANPLNVKVSSVPVVPPSTDELTKALEESNAKLTEANNQLASRTAELAEANTRIAAARTALGPAAPTALLARGMEEPTLVQVGWRLQPPTDLFETETNERNEND